MEDFSRIKELSKDELTEHIKWSQNYINSCIDELRRRHELEVENLRKKLSKIGAISNDENSPSKTHSSSNIKITDKSAGNDCDGNYLYPGDLVEILSPSKNGTPFKYKEIAKVMKSPGEQIRLGSLDDGLVTGYRAGKNVRLKESH